MPSSGGSVSDAPVNKVVNGQNHYLAYITPDEGKTLEQTGSVLESTPEGIPSYGGHRGGAEKTAAAGGVGAQGEGPIGGEGPEKGGFETYMAPVDVTEQYTSGPTETKDSLVTKFKEGLVDNKYVKNVITKMGWVTDNSLMNALGGAVTVIGMLGTEAQSKAMTWGLENRLKSIQKQKDFHPGAYGYKISDIQSDIEGIKDGTFTQKDYTKKYGSGDTTNPLDKSYIPPTGGDNARGLTNIITPYAAHAIGGTTPVNSMAAQWYAGLGSGPSNPGAFNLTQQYAAAKAAVSQRLGTPTSVGQMAVSNSPFFNFLKDNSLNKGIL